MLLFLITCFFSYTNNAYAAANIIVSDTNGYIIQGDDTHLYDSVTLHPLGDSFTGIPKGQGTGLRPIFKTIAIGDSILLGGAGYSMNDELDIKMDFPAYSGTRPNNFGVQANTSQGIYFYNNTTSSSIDYVIDAVRKSNGTSISNPILIPQNYHGGKSVTVNKQDFLGFVVSQANKDKFEITESPTAYTVKQSVNGPGELFAGIKGALLIKNGTRLTYSTPASDGVNNFAGSMGWFTLTGADFFRMKYDKPEIVGLTDLEVAKFEIKQEIKRQFNDAFYPDVFTIVVDLDSKLYDLSKINNNSISIKNTLDNSVITPSSISVEGDKLNININKAILSSISVGQDIDIQLSVPLSQNIEMLEQYYQPDGYYHVPATASNNQNEGTSTDYAKVKRNVYITGTPNPQTVELNSTTDDLDLNKLVSNMTSTFPNDKVTIKKIKEYKVFSKVGPTFVEVIIEGNLSGYQNVIKVPVTVTEPILDTILTVEFYNDKDELDFYLEIPVTLWDRINILENPDMIDILTSFDDAGLEIISRPTNETDFLIDQMDMTVSYTYKEKGSLTIASAPNNIDFGSLKYDAKIQRINEVLVDSPLIVSDTRGESGNGWQLYAKVTQDMTAIEDSDSVLVDAIRYMHNGSEKTLSTSNQLIYSNDKKVENINISDQWGSDLDSDGLKLVVDPKVSKISNGSYEGVIVWQLMEGTP